MPGCQTCNSAGVVSALLLSACAWALAVWYIGWDVYNLFANADNGVVDVMAHVTGGAAGYLFGVTFLRRKRQEIQEMRLIKPIGEPGII